VCTPDFFGFDADLRLRHHGRLDAGGMRDVPGLRRELFEAISAITGNGQGPGGATGQHRLFDQVARRLKGVSPR
jgi:hypothetical protein